MYTISPYLAEFLGTLIMCTIGCGVIANVEPSVSTPPTHTPAATSTPPVTSVRAATYTPTGSMPILMPEEIKGNRSILIVNRVTENG